jgi:hypothetical protein
MRSTAPVSTGAGATSDSRNHPAPPGPNALPGVTTTLASSSSAWMNAHSSAPAGTGSQRYIAPFGAVTVHPAARNASTAAVRRSSYPAATGAASSRACESAWAPACCTSVETP